MEQQHLLFLLHFSSAQSLDRRFSSVSKIKIIRLIFDTRSMKFKFIESINNDSNTKWNNSISFSFFTFPPRVWDSWCDWWARVEEQSDSRGCIRNEPFSEESHPRGYLSSFSIIFAKVTPWVWTRYESIEGIFTRFSRADSKQERSRSCKINRCT